MKSSDKHYYQQYIGDIDGYFLKKYRCCDGKMDGVRAIDIRNSKGLQMTVLPDRCLDIPYLYYKGTQIAFCSKTGIVAPSYFTEDGSRGFLRNFNGGFLTTCGLTYTGASCEDNNEVLGAHGTIGNTPASQVSCKVNYDNTDVTVDIKGNVRQAKVFDENMLLNRKIVCETETNIIRICDTVANEGFTVQPLMVLYHFNFGYPMLSEHTKLYFNSDKVTPRDSVAKKGVEKHNVMEAPSPAFDEQVFFHHFNSKKELGQILVHNEKLNLAVLLCFDLKVCPWLMEWKCLKSGDYALGIEPANCHVLGRAAAKERNDLQYIKPAEKVEYDFSIEIFDDSDIILNLIDIISNSKLEKK